MNQEPEKKGWFWQGIVAFAVIAASILFYYLLQHLGSISSFFGSVLQGLSAIIWGLVLAYLLDPVVAWYETKLKGIMFRKQPDSPKAPKIIRTTAALLTLLTAVAFLTLLGILVVPEISRSITGIIKELPSQIDSLITQLEDRTFFDNALLSKVAGEAMLTTLSSLESWIKSDLPSQANVLFEYFYTSVKGVFSVVFNLVVGLILSVYIAIDKELLIGQVKKLAYVLMPEEKIGGFRQNLRNANNKFSHAIRGKILDSAIIGLICFIVLTLLNLLPWLDFPYPVLLAVIVGITNVVPFFGPFVGGFITAVLVLFDNPHMVVWYVIWIVILQQFDCNYLDPHIVGGSIGLRPFWSIFACLLGSALLGVPGFVIGPPVFAFFSELLNGWMNGRLVHMGKAEKFGLPEDGMGEKPITPREPLRVHISNGLEKFRQFVQKHTK